MADVVVVGGGIAGLTAATFLARAGREVVLLERAAELGGRGTSRVQDGFTFNLGPHAVYRKGPGTAVLHELGITLRGDVPARGYLAEVGGELGLLPVDPVSLLRTRLLSVREKLQVGGLLARLPRIDAGPLSEHTVAQWLDASGLSGRARLLMAGMFRLSSYGHDPEHQSAGAAISQLQHAFANVLYLDGGWASLVRDLRAQAVTAGVAIRERAGVRGLLTGHGRVAAQLADGSIEAGAAVLAVPPATAAALSGSAELTRAALRLRPSRMATLDVALRALPDRGRPFLMSLDRPLYASVHSLAATLAPEGGAVVHVARYLGPSRAMEPSLVRAELEGFLDLLQPGWRNEVAHVRFLPDLVVSHHVVTAATGGMSGRPPVAVPDAPGVFLAGDWVGDSGQLVHASLASARRAAELVLAAAGTRRAA
jgi:phytoene dehydrogenase-like protein